MEWVRTWYALGTLVYSLGYSGGVCMMYGVSTEWVWTEGGVSIVESILRGVFLYPPQVHTRCVFLPDHVIVILVPNWSQSFWTLSMLKNLREMNLNPGASLRISFIQVILLLDLQ